MESVDIMANQPAPPQNVPPWEMRPYDQDLVRET